jgi:recombination DNA repair RAD52 pathway protein
VFSNNYRLQNKELENIVVATQKLENIETIKPVLNSSTNPTAKQNSKNNKTLINTTITQFYPVRRSERKTKTEIQEENSRDIEQAIKEGREDGLAVIFSLFF